MKGNIYDRINKDKANKNNIVNDLKTKLNESESELAIAKRNAEALSFDNVKDYQEAKRKESEKNDAVDFYKAKLNEAEQTELYPDPEEKKSIIQGITDDITSKKKVDLQETKVALQKAQNHVDHLLSEYDRADDALTTINGKKILNDRLSIVSLLRQINTAIDIANNF